jgi:hypothetical protein
MIKRAKPAGKPQKRINESLEFQLAKLSAEEKSDLPAFLRVW